MANRLTRPLTLVFIAQIAAFWPVWLWYVERLTAPAGGHWGWLCLLSAALILNRYYRSPPVDHIGGRQLWQPGLLILLYLLTFHWIPPLFRAAIAFLSILTTLRSTGVVRRMPPAVIGLTLLALPIMPSLQFYFGYPLRYLTATGSAILLSVNGLEVSAQGTGLLWNGQFILVDAPCSGLRMLWTGGFLMFTLAAWLRLNFRGLSLTLFAGTALIVLANIWRSAALFYIENEGLAGHFAGWWHGAVGLVIFSLTAVCIYTLATNIGRRPACAS